MVVGPYSAAVLSEQRNTFFSAVGVGVAAERVARARNGMSESFIFDYLEELACEGDIAENQSSLNNNFGLWLLITTFLYHSSAHSGPQDLSSGAAEKIAEIFNCLKI